MITHCGYCKYCNFTTEELLSPTKGSQKYLYLLVGGRRDSAENLQSSRNMGCRADRAEI